MASTESTITLVANDGTEFVVPLNIANKSATIYNMLEDLGLTDQTVPIPLVSPDILKKIIDFLTSSEADLQVDKTAEPTAFIKAFIPENLEDVFKLILAANFLDIKSLLDVLCKDVARRLHEAKTPKNIRDDVFNMHSSTFTKADEQEILAQNPWLGTEESKISFII